MRKLIVIVLCSLTAGPAFADDAVLELERSRAAGRIDRETWLVEVFRLAFGPDRTADRPFRCLTPVIAEYRKHRDGLSAAAVREIDGYLSRPATALRATYISPGGNFEFTYFTTGADAVDPTDVSPANGVPDYVERCAAYADTSWNELVTNLGLTAPGLPGDGTYDFSFEALGAGFYGYTTIQGSTTRIVIHNTFAGGGWPGGNDDPEGDILGRAKVTIAHEFQHAIQYTTSGWSEGGWVELDAMWAEDTVFDQTNDYHNWIDNGSLSQLDSPETRLDNGGTGSYEDCLWEYYMAERHGNSIIVDLWDIRGANPAQSMKNSYGAVLSAYGSSWNEAWPEFYEWCWFTGSRAAPPFGFSDAPDYYRMELVEAVVTSLPYDSGPQSVDRLSAHPRRFQSATATGQPRIVFDGEDGHPNFTVSVIAEEADGTFTIVQAPLDGNNDADWVVPQTWSALEYVGVIVSNANRNGTPKAYSLQVLDSPVSTGAELAGPAAAPLTLHAARPNPFRGSTEIAWSLPATARGRVRIYDVAGRSVRTLASGDLAAGPGTVIWDGTDDRGRPVPAGVYWSRVETGAGSVAKRLTVLR